ncbi:MAG: class I SAM-dependent methyltransferase [Methanobacteriaceae archaeon]|nr:class I SAM-dependent methyltransferase [Methanobacteriaceae archaeon]
MCDKNQNLKTDEWSSSKFYSMADQYYRDNQNNIINRIPERENGKLLDIGCNDGTFTLKMAHKSKCSPYGIEMNEKLALKAREKGVSVTVADANYEIPFEDNYFDIIVSNQVIEHLNNVDGFFKEVYRILKDDGIAVLSTTNISSLHNLGMILFGMQPPSFHVSEIQVGNPLFGTKTDGHQQIFTTSALKDLAKYHGFDIEKTFGTGHYFFPSAVSKIFSSVSPRYCIYIGISLRKI